MRRASIDRKIENTLKYTQLVKFEESDAYFCKVAKTEDEIKILIESGFQYMCENEELKFFRKPK